MFSLMLNVRFVLNYLVSSLIVCEQGKAIVEKYDNFFISYAFEMLLSFASIG